ncbi:hypothetical protein C1645_834108 [Glomus cerebriforme]|uniref:Uncharacterized protein n=1 Tax=Glomus cerebriforme TaxID=658196 RepID=A0A397SK78_9GLOM|nr:hypothetical protein C1645_834108 [Glomus cerebriforme]
MYDNESEQINIVKSECYLYIGNLLNPEKEVLSNTDENDKINWKFYLISISEDQLVDWKDQLYQANFHEWINIEQVERNYQNQFTTQQGIFNICENSEEFFSRPIREESSLEIEENQENQGDEIVDIPLPNTDS